jgi:ACS family tartrate transporter-like MFS transporter
MVEAGLGESIGARTIQKLRIRLLPFLFILYIVAFLDRINIGFAALTMNRELSISSQQFGLAVGVFFFGYCLLEIPSNLVLRKVGARKWIARILISWGIIAAATGLVQSAPQLYVARFLLGLAEAGFFPGILLYLTYWFPQREQARAIALFMTALPVATILGSPVSGLILDHVNWLNLGGWRWLFILEGTPALLLGLLTYVLLPNDATEAGFLAKFERIWLTTTLNEEASQKHQRFALDAVRALSQPRVWLLACIGFTQAIGFYSLAFWMPQAIKALSSLYSSTYVGLLVMIPHVVGLSAMVLVARSSDGRLERRYHMTVPLIVGGIGFISLSAAHTSLAAVTLFALGAIGVYSIFGPFFASATAFLTGLSAASGIALITSISNLGGFVGPYAVGAVTRQTGTLYGGFVFAGISLCVCAALCLLLPRERPLVLRADSAA